MEGLTQPVQSIFMHPPYNQGRSNFYTLSSLGKKSLKVRGNTDNFNMDYYTYDEWTPQEISIKRNFDIKKLKRETKVATTQSLAATLSAIRDKFQLQQIQSNKERQRQIQMSRPYSQGQLIACSQLFHSVSDYKNYLSKEFLLNNKHLTSPLQNQDVQKSVTQNSFNNRAQQLAHLKKGYALSFKAPKVQVTKNSIFHLDSTPISTMQIPFNSNQYQNEVNSNGDQGTAENSPMVSTKRNYPEIREPRFSIAPQNPNSQLESIQQKEYVLDLNAQKQQSYPIFSVNFKQRATSRGNLKSSDEQPPRNKNLYFNSNSPTPKNRALMIGSRKTAFKNQKMFKFVSIDDFIKDSMEISTEKDKNNQSLDEYLNQYKEDLNSKAENPKFIIPPSAVQKPDKKFLSSNDELFMNCFQCTALPSPPNIPIQESVKIQNYSQRDRYYKISNEIVKIKKIIENDAQNKHYYAMTYLSKILNKSDLSQDQLDLFIGFIKKFDLPPFIPGLSLKELLVLIIDNKIDEFLMEQQGSPKTEKHFKDGVELNVILNIDQRIIDKKKKQIENQKNLQKKVDNFKNTINDNYSKFNFNSINDKMQLQGKIQKLREEHRIFQIIQKKEKQPITMMKKSKSSIINIKEHQGAFSSEKFAKQPAVNKVQIESLMLKRIEDRQKEEDDAQAIADDKFSVQWNSRSLYWKDNPTLQGAMSHKDFFNTQKQPIKLRKIY